ATEAAPDPLRAALGERTVSAAGAARAGAGGRGAARARARAGGAAGAGAGFSAAVASIAQGAARMLLLNQLRYFGGMLLIVLVVGIGVGLVAKQTRALDLLGIGPPRSPVDAANRWAK